MLVSLIDNKEGNIEVNIIDIMIGDKLKLAGAEFVEIPFKDLVEDSIFSVVRHIIIGVNHSMDYPIFNPVTGKKNLELDLTSSQFKDFLLTMAIESGDDELYERYDKLKQVRINGDDIDVHINNGVETSEIVTFELAKRFN